MKNPREWLSHRIEKSKSPFQRVDLGSWEILSILLASIQDSDKLKGLAGGTGSPSDWVGRRVLAVTNPASSPSSRSKRSHEKIIESSVRLHRNVFGLQLAWGFGERWSLQRYSRLRVRSERTPIDLAQSGGDDMPERMLSERKVGDR